MSDQATKEYLEKFAKFSLAKQRRHIMITVQFIVNMIKDQQAHALTAKPTSPLDEGAIDGECEVTK